MQAQAVTGWAQGPHWPQHQHPPTPAATTTGATGTAKPRRPLSATAALGSRALPPTGPSAEEKGDDGTDNNGHGVSARSSELRQLTAADDGASTLLDGHGSHVHHHHQSDAHDVA